MKVDLRAFVYLLMLVFSILLLFLFLISRHLLRRLAKNERESMESILAAQENERAIMAREVHDNLGPLLSVTKLQVSYLRMDHSAENLSTILPELEHQLTEAMAIVRQVSHELSPFIFPDTTLQDALEDYIARINQTGKLNILFVSDIQDMAIPVQIVRSVSRIVRELLNNTINHAAAMQVDISLCSDDHGLCLKYRDDGKGMDMAAATSGIGLRSIQSRLNALQAKAVWNKGNGGAGFNVTMHIPLAQTTQGS